MECIEVKCPYCGETNFVNTSEDWERPKCPKCGGMYYMDKVVIGEVTAFDDKGKGTNYTIEVFGLM